jgi:ribosomal protein S18 acetylase RimI-like enzyme
MPLRGSSPRLALNKLSTRVRTRGSREVVDLAGHRVREFVRSEDRIIFFALDPAAPAASHPPPSGGSFRRARADDAPAFARYIGTDSEASFRARMSDDTRCYLVLTGDLIVHASWVTTSRAWTRELRRYFSPPRGEAYVYESFTRPEVRGQGAYPFALASIAQDLRADGIKRAWVGVEAGNAPSIKAVRKAGFEPGFEIGYSRCLGRVAVGRPQGPLAGQCGKCLTRG